MTLIISLAASLVAMLILFVLLVAVGHIDDLFNRRHPEPRGFEVIRRGPREGDA